MPRVALSGYYRRYEAPANRTVVLVGDVDTDEALRRVEHYFGSIEPGSTLARIRTLEPEQTGERRLTIRKEGTTAYLKVGYHAPSASDPQFFPMLVLDAVLTGAKGLNLWSSFRVPPPQRSARLYRALVDRRLATSIFGFLIPTQHPFLYTLSATATAGTSLGAIESVLLDELDRVRREGITSIELAKATAQLKARLVFETDSVTSIAHQLGYFATIADTDIYTQAQARIAAVTLDQIAEAARTVFVDSNRTVGWFDPLPIGASAAESHTVRSG